MDIENNMFSHNNNLSPYACLDTQAIWLKNTTNDFRSPFFRDIDRIIYTLSFQRYSDKTQVFSFKDNDHIQKRMIHVQYVSKIARTIGRALGINEDLIEAIALGHDLGHTPFGHAGESILNEISLANNEGYFNHNIHSVRLLTAIENYGLGKDITLQTLDGIMCHNGEFVEGIYRPIPKDKNKFLNEYEESYKTRDILKTLRPMTLEGCVVRISDLIAYLGRDIEDAIRMNLVSFADIPKNITSILGSSNKEIVNNIVKDIIANSINKDYIKLSDEVYKAIKDLKTFNYKNIYNKAYTKEEHEKLKLMLNTLFNTYLEDIENNNEDSHIINSYLKNMQDKYKDSYTNERIVIDYIAGMTDSFVLKEYNKIIRNKHNIKEVENDL